MSPTEERKDGMLDKRDKQELKKNLLTLAAAAVLICLIIMIFFRTGSITGPIKKAIGILSPFFWGIAIAYLLRPVELWFEKWLTKLESKISKKHHPGLMRFLGIILALIFLIAIIILLLMMVLPQVIQSIRELISQIPGAIEEFRAWIVTLDRGEKSHEVVTAVLETVDTLSARLQNFLQTDVLPNLQTLVSSVTSSFMGIVDVCMDFGLGCIVAAYILGGWERFVRQGAMVVYGLFPKRGADWIRKEVHYADKVFGGFIQGKLFDSFIIGLITFAFTMLTKMPYAPLVSVIIGVTNIIPFFGPWMGAIPSTILILTVSPVKAVSFFIYVVVLQQFDGNFLGPKILGDSVGLSAIWIMFAILWFGALWGLVGMIIGVPLFAILYDLFRSLIYRLLHVRGQEERIEIYEEEFHKK